MGSWLTIALAKTGMDHIEDLSMDLKLNWCGVVFSRMDALNQKQSFPMQILEIVLYK